MTTTPADVNALSFEDALEEMERVVHNLENGGVSLEESITLYERGESLRRRCEALLKEAEMRIEKINTAANGAPLRLSPLDEDRNDA